MGSKKFINLQNLGYNMAYSKEQILKLLYRQLDNLFIISDEECNEISSVVDDVLERCRINFQASDNKYFIANGWV